MSDYLIKMLLSLLSVVAVTLAYPQTHTEDPKPLKLPSSEPSTTTTKQEDIIEIFNDTQDSEQCDCVPYEFCDEVDIVGGFGYCRNVFYACCKNPKPEEPVTSKIKVKRGCGYSNPHHESAPSTKSTNSLETPWVVALMMGSTTVGGGALVHPQAVLTAAHVAAKYSNATLVVRAGDWHTQTDKHRLQPQERSVEIMKIHKEFVNTSLWNDIALLRLQTPMNLEEHIDVICLPDQDEEFDQSRGCVASGWKRDKSEAVTLKQVEADVLPSESCQAKLKLTRLSKWFKLNKSFLCAEEKKGFTCTGDGGAPLACPGAEAYKVCGLVAWGIGCGDDIPAVYARVSMFREWIDDTMREWGFGAEWF